MPTNANTFNSRVTSEALEKKFRDVFPAQGGAELVQDLFASGVIQPVIDFSSVAEGSVLSTDLQTAWDFATGSGTTFNTSASIISTPGFWLVDLTLFASYNSVAASNAAMKLSDGLTTKNVWAYNAIAGLSNNDRSNLAEAKFVVFLRSGDSLQASTSDTHTRLTYWYRQIADVSGNLVNPLGFVSS